jgi:predicted Zn-dependent protease
VLRAVSAVVGLVGCGVLFEAAEHGGDLVYTYAGGPGLRTGDARDVDRLLLAGLFNKMQQDRREKRVDDATMRLQEIAKLVPGDTTVRFIAIEMMLQDRKNPAAAMAMLDSMPLPEQDRLYLRAGLLKADALLALGQQDSAKALLQKLATLAPTNRGVRDRLQAVMK